MKENVFITMKIKLNFVEEKDDSQPTHIHLFAQISALFVFWE